MRRAHERMRDYRQITWHGADFKPQDALAIHRRCRAWLGEQIDQIRRREPSSRLVVVSHHAPVPIILEPRVTDLAACYASDLGSAIAIWRPDVWFHGHSHRTPPFALPRYLGGLRAARISRPERPRFALHARPDRVLIPSSGRAGFRLTSPGRTA